MCHNNEFYIKLKGKSVLLKLINKYDHSGCPLLQIFQIHFKMLNIINLHVLFTILLQLILLAPNGFINLLLHS